MPSVRPPAGSHDHAALALVGDVMTEEETDRHLEEVRQASEVGDRRDGQAAFHLARPAHGSTEAQRHLGQGQAARLAQGAKVAGKQLVGAVAARPCAVEG